MIQKAKRNTLKARHLASIVSDTLQAHSFGEFDLPSWLVRYTEGEKAKLGIHREFYLPIAANPSFVGTDSVEAKEIFRFQAAEVVNEVLADGFRVQEHELDLVLCSNCR